MKKALIITGITTFILILLAFILYNLFDNGKFTFVNPNSEKYTIRGIDVSHHQHTIDWETVKQSNIIFAFIKATEGDDFKDRMFEINWREALKNDIIPGAYHFYSLRYSGLSQATNFINTVPDELNSLPPVIDLEYGGNSKIRPPKQYFIEDLKEYIDLIEYHYNKEPILYTTENFYNDYLHPEFADYKIWIRSIFFEPDIIGFDNWVFWQYNARGHISGIEGFVDLNVFNGSLEEFNDLLY